VQRSGDARRGLDNAFGATWRRTCFSRGARGGRPRRRSVSSRLRCRSPCWQPPAQRRVDRGPLCGAQWAFTRPARSLCPPAWRILARGHGDPVYRLKAATAASRLGHGPPACAPALHVPGGRRRRR
jgi:hypothetical protein